MIAKVATIELNCSFTKPPINMDDIVMSRGKRPLQGTKLLVIIAMRRSLGDSIIRHDITPAALHPNPMHMVRDCLPWAPARLKKLSKLKATLGRYPRSSRSVKRGKKIAMGGSMTDITQAEVLYTPNKSMSCNV